MVNRPSVLSTSGSTAAEQNELHADHVTLPEFGELTSNDMLDLGSILYTLSCIILLAQLLLIFIKHHLPKF